MSPARVRNRVVFSLLGVFVSINCWDKISPRPTSAGSSATSPQSRPATRCSSSAPFPATRTGTDSRNLLGYDATPTSTRQRTSSGTPMKSVSGTANDRLQGRGRPGFLTDMGQVFLLFGFPTRSSSGRNANVSVPERSSSPSQEIEGSTTETTPAGRSGAPATARSQTWLYDADPTMGLPSGLEVRFRARPGIGYRLVESEELDEVLESRRAGLVAWPDIGYDLDGAGNLLPPSLPSDATRATELLDALLALCQPHLDFLESQWIPGRRDAAVSNLTLTDGDTTALVFDVLSRYGRKVDLEGVLHYDVGDHFRCFGLEANPSISTNIHVLGALRRAGLGLERENMRAVLAFLKRTQTLNMFWFDKWHASPYYTTAHAILSLTGLADMLIDDAIYWVVTTQNRDGSWGYYMPTAEETAYCLQALSIWKQSGGRVPQDVIERGTFWLEQHAEPPYAPLWIGKSLYAPVLVVRSAILSALALAREGEHGH